MTAAEREELRALIRARIDAAEQAASAGADNAATVTLDQQSVGRLSRMDALQAQAMAKATGARRRAEITRLRAALARLDDDDFGECDDCGAEIGLARLRIEPTLSRCMACMKGA
ncbi:MAG: TraR/DksA C4-type zinc finger protein [Pseudomonadota bacterium]